VEKSALQSLSAALQRHMTRRARTGARWAYPSDYDGGLLEPEPAAFVDESNAAAAATTGPSSLSVIREDLGDCTRCKLHDGRKNIVFGVGNPNARLMVVGEGPGQDEDEQGEPFVGNAGQLLTRILGAIGLSRDDVYIANVVKCRPPGNRNPEPDEISECRPFLERQIASVRPHILVGLGNVAVKALLDTEQGIMKLRGNWREYKGIAFMPTLHPAYVLRNPEEGRPLVWQDMLKVAERYNDGLPAGEKRAEIRSRGTASED
jgi:uracil-DNA glycosylase family 4